MEIESFSNLPIQTVIPSYLYNEYSDDSDLQAFVDSYNALSQGYLDWFNSTPLSVYTNQSVSGSLLDWVGLGLYGIDRPVISTQMLSKRGQYLSAPYGSKSPYAMLTITKSGTSVIASDDIYKRALTWSLYAGDGQQMSIFWLKKRIARFLYGINGSDVSLDDVLNVGIQFNTMKIAKGYVRELFARQPYMTTTVITTGPEINISIPNNPIGVIFQTLFNGGILPRPFQAQFTVTLV